MLVRHLNRLKCNNNRTDSVAEAQDDQAIGCKRVA